MSTDLEARRLMLAHAKMVDRTVQWMVNTGQLSYGDFDEACAAGKVALAERAHSHDPARGGEVTHLWGGIYGALLTWRKRERRYYARTLPVGLLAACDYLNGRRPPEDPRTFSPERALAELREAAGGFATALALGHLSGIWGLDAETQVAAREEHARALDLLQVELSHLAEREQRLLHMHYAEGQTWPEVARHFGVGPSTVDRWHRAAIRRLRKALETRDVARSPPQLDSG